MEKADPSSKEGLLQFIECKKVAKDVRELMIHLLIEFQILSMLLVGAPAPGTL